MPQFPSRGNLINRSMSKRRATSDGASSDSDSESEARQFSHEYRELCLSLMRGDAGSPISPADLSKCKGAPSKRTLYRWRGEGLPPAERDHTGGRPPLLTDDELKIVGGFILFCGEQHQHCGVREIQDFIWGAFDIQVLEPWVSKHVHKLGFSSHRPASLKYTYGGTTNLVSAIQTLTELQSDLAKVEDRSRIVALDQISFWDCGIITSTYGPTGGYAMIAPPSI